MQAIESMNADMDKQKWKGKEISSGRDDEEENQAKMEQMNDKQRKPYHGKKYRKKASNNENFSVISWRND